VNNADFALIGNFITTGVYMNIHSKINQFGNSGNNEILINDSYEFYGRHLMLNFMNCKFNLEDHEKLKTNMIYAIEKVGATILSFVEHKFDPQGITILFLLSESHASIHTYPEYNSCFLDIFTCGRVIDVKPFGEILKELWMPANVSVTYQERIPTC
jgi:S-adenosylmethionine decarboxylase